MKYYQESVFNKNKNKVNNDDNGVAVSQFIKNTREFMSLVSNMIKNPKSMNVNGPEYQQLAAKFDEARAAAQQMQGKASKTVEEEYMITMVNAELMQMIQEATTEENVDGKTKNNLMSFIKNSINRMRSCTSKEQISKIFSDMINTLLNTLDKTLSKYDEEPDEEDESIIRVHEYFETIQESIDPELYELLYGMIKNGNYGARAINDKFKTQLENIRKKEDNTPEKEDNTPEKEESEEENKLPSNVAAYDPDEYRQQLKDITTKKSIFNKLSKSNKRQVRKYGLWVGTACIIMAMIFGLMSFIGTITFADWWVETPIMTPTLKLVVPRLAEFFSVIGNFRYSTINSSEYKKTAQEICFDTINGGFKNIRAILEELTSALYKAGQVSIDSDDSKERFDILFSNIKDVLNHKKNIVSNYNKCIKDIFEAENGKYSTKIVNNKQYDQLQLSRGVVAGISLMMFLSKIYENKNINKFDIILPDQIHNFIVHEPDNSLKIARTSAEIISKFIKCINDAPIIRSDKKIKFNESIALKIKQPHSTQIFYDTSYKDVQKLLPLCNHIMQINDQTEINNKTTEYFEDLYNIIKNL